MKALYRLAGKAEGEEQETLLWAIDTIAGARRASTYLDSLRVLASGERLPATRTAWVTWLVGAGERRCVAVREWLDDAGLPTPGGKDPGVLRT